MKTSPVLMMKAKKNSVEVAGMKNAHLKDAVAVCDFFSQLDQEVLLFFNHLYSNNTVVTRSSISHRHYYDSPSV